MSSAYVNNAVGRLLVLTPEEPAKSLLSPVETKVLHALSVRTSVEKLCKGLDFEHTEDEVLESIKSLTAKGLIIVVCSAYPWGVEFDYFSKEVALDELRRKAEISAKT